MVRFLALAIFLTACSSSESDEPDYKFGAAEAQSALTGDWTGTWSAGGKTGAIDLKLAMATPVATPKCGNRTLSGDLAPKCIDVTTVRLVGTLTTSDGAFGGASMNGALEVFATTLTDGQLDLKTTDGKTLTARYVSPSFKDGRVMLPAGEATFTLSRR